MHPSAEAFVERARDEEGIEVDVYEFPEGTKTAADAADAIGCEVAQIAKSIVMSAGGDLVVVVTSGANRVDEDRLADALDADPRTVRTANPDEVKATLGWSIGGVPPFCHDADVRVLFDETLTGFETVWGAAGTPDAVFPIAPEAIVETADAEVATIAE